MERSGGDPVCRGDAVLCDLNLVVGTEQAGVRPALVVQIDRANTVSPHTIIVPFTTRIRQALLPSHVLIPAGVGGLTHDSVALCEQIRVIDNGRLIRQLGGSVVGVAFMIELAFLHGRDKLKEQPLHSLIVYE